MIIKRFSKTLNTNSPGFIRDRKYDQDFSRLGKLKTQRQLSNGSVELNREMRKLGKELNDGRLGKWQHTE